VARLSRGRVAALSAVAAVAAVVVLVFVVAGRRSDGPPAATRPALPPARAAALVEMRPFDRRLCHASALLRPVCPRRVPAAIYPRRGVYLAPHGAPGERYDRFELIAVPRRGRPQHVVLFASRYGLDRVFTSAPRVRLGRPTWGGLRGVLVVDSSRPVAGEHVVFRWRSRGVDYALALAAWKPMRDAVATLRAIVVGKR
jgi:hypothetical protein